MVITRIGARRRWLRLRPSVRCGEVYAEYTGAACRAPLAERAELTEHAGDFLHRAVMVVASNDVVPKRTWVRVMVSKKPPAFHDVCAATAMHVQVDKARQQVGQVVFSRVARCAFIAITLPCSCTRRPRIQPSGVRMLSSDMGSSLNSQFSGIVVAAQFCDEVVVVVAAVGVGDFDRRVVGGVANPGHQQHGGAGGDAHQARELVRGVDRLHMLQGADDRFAELSKYSYNETAQGLRLRQHRGWDDGHFDRHHGVIGFAQALESRHFVAGRQAQADQFFVGRGVMSRSSHCELGTKPLRRNISLKPDKRDSGCSRRA
ncbi:hypothetical protein Ddc_24314 [Ditylenchus destructor]|nr:hypothetical protein Ddc_24314 [Ditylenchus destructor]